MKRKNLAVVTAGIFTGSRVYGKAHVKSDLDLVILVNQDQLTLLENMCDGKSKHYPTGDTMMISMHFGSLNLICVTDPVAFAVWVKGTQKLKRMATDSGYLVSREDAVGFLSKMRKQHGVKA